MDQTRRVSFTAVARVSSKEASARYKTQAACMQKQKVKKPYKEKTMDDAYDARISNHILQIKGERLINNNNNQ